MRNLKKTLCLALALVLVLGLCTIGVGAADFADEAEVKYENASTVLAGLGIIQGDDNDGDGKFELRPGDSITRAEAAKMTTYMVLGKSNAEKLIAKEAFDDVSASHWAAKYIYFCYNKNIVNGYGDGSFGPSDPVTGTQLSKMLLAACGYGMMGEYTGSGWDVNVFVDAVTEGIYDSAETEDYAAPATRDEACLYVFNTLLGVNQVAYDVDLNKYDQEYRAPFGFDVWKLNWTSPDYSPAGAETHHDYVLQRNQATGAKYTVVDGRNYAVETGLELIGHAVEIYYRDIARKDAEGDVYYDAYLVKDISKVVPVGMTATLGELAKTMGYPDTPFADIAIWNNYVKTDEALLDTLYDGFLKDKGPASEDDEATDLADKGFATGTVKTANTQAAWMNGLSFTASIILNERGDVLGYMNSSYAIGQVSAIDSEDGVTLKFAGGVTETYAPETTTAYEGIKKGDYVTLQPVGEKHTLLPTSTVNATVFQKDDLFGWFNNSAYMGGHYTQTVSNAAFTDAAGVKPGDTVRFYIDAYGSYFGIELIASGVEQGYVFFVKSYAIEKPVSVYDDTTMEYYYAQCVDASGNEVNYLIDKAAAGSLASGVYKAVASTTTASDGYYPAGLSKVNLSLAANSDVRTTAESFSGYGKENKLPGGPYYLSDSARYFFVSGELASLSVTEASFLNSGEQKVYFYYNEAGSVYSVPVVWVTGKRAPMALASSYIYVTETDINGQVFPAAYASGSVLINNETYYNFNVYIDGESKTIPLAEGPNGFETVEVPGATLRQLPQGFYKYAVDTNGVYALEKAEAQDTAVLKKGNRDNYLYGVYLSVNDSANGYAFDADISALTLKDISGAVNSKGYLRNISSIETLQELIADGYEATIAYAVGQDGGKYTPAGAIYLLALTDPAE